MKWHSRQFEKSLRRGVRRAIRSSRELNKEYRRVRAARKRIPLGPLARMVGMGAVAFFMWLLLTDTGHLATALALLNLCNFTVLFTRAQNFVGCLYQEHDIKAYAFLPVAESAVFARQLRKFFGKSLYVLGDILAGLIVLGWWEQLAWWQWLLIGPGALAIWITLLAAALFAVLRFPRLVTIAASLCGVAWALLIIFNSQLPLVDLLDRHAGWLNVVLPTGWAPTVILTVLTPGQWAGLGWIIPIAGLWWWAGNMLLQLRETYYFQEVPIAPAADVPPEEIPTPEPEAETEAELSMPAAAPRHFGLTAIEEIVQTRHFLTPLAWQERGWLERQLWRWFNVRERTLTELVFPNGIGLSSRWLKVFRNLLLALAAGWAIGYVSAAAQPWVLGVGICATFVQILALLLNSGRAFQPVFCSGVNVPLYAAYPIGFWELSRMFLKYSVVQLPVLLVWGTVCGVVLTRLTGLPLGWEYGLLRGVPVVGVIFGARFILVLFGFNSGTNDSTKFQVRMFFLFVVIVVFGLAFLILGVLGLLLPYPWLVLGCTLAAVALAGALFWIYSWFYHRARFDLMSQPRR